MGKGGLPDCQIRSCAKEKGIEVCPQCKNYPCTLIKSLSEHYPTLIQDGKRMQTVGVKKWVREQEEMVKRGVVYADIRYKTES
ncbi:MAG: DUF3795 domain-containing protein [Candidatus Bathyarchaeales archaeon]